MVNNIAGEHSMTRDAPPLVRRPGKARVLTEAELDELHMRQFLAMSVGLAVACMLCLKI